MLGVNRRRHPDSSRLFLSISLFNGKAGSCDAKGMFILAVADCPDPIAPPLVL